MTDVNPLLMNLDLPLFSSVDAEHVGPAIDQVLEQNRAELAELSRTQPEFFTWKNFALRLDELQARLERVWATVSHLNSVCNTKEMRKAHEDTLGKLAVYGAQVGQNRSLLNGYLALLNGPEYGSYDTAQRTVIQNALRDFKLSGVDLDEAGQCRFRELSVELSELGSRFSNNVLDATQAWTRLLENEASLSGVPSAAKAFMRASAEARGLQGWLLTLEMPCVQAVLTHADDRALREEIYYANITRASETGPNAGGFDNGPLIEKITHGRVELARLLGFENYAELSLASKMASSPDEVLSFLRDLAQRSRPTAVEELHHLRRFVTEQGIESMQAWDQAYYSEKYREAHFAVSQETLRRYFPVDQVVKGMFDLVTQLYGIHITELTEFDSWHADVRLFEISENGQRVGRFFLDLYARPNKRAGAWMYGFAGRRVDVQATVHEPLAHMVCNFAPGTGSQPALLSHVELVTLFHEFGHCLHHLLTRVQQASVAGVKGVAWDAVELPSQFMENWCWQPDVLKRLSSHVESGEQLPDALISSLLRTRTFLAGIATLRQVEIALFDFELHIRTEPTDPTALMADVREEVAVFIPPIYNRFAHSLQHIFSGGYAAGYYSYKWAEVLAADAFARFEEEGLFNPTVGAAFRETVLANGGAEPALTLFNRFRGRAPRIDALLQAHGLARTSVAIPAA